jgi:hypothetical protein
VSPGGITGAHGALASHKIEITEVDDPVGVPTGD